MSMIWRVLLTPVFLSHPGDSGATITWTKIAGGNWNQSANWQPNQMPGSGNTANITVLVLWSLNWTDATQDCEAVWKRAEKMFRPAMS